MKNDVLAETADLILAKKRDRHRSIVAIVGPPGTGKTTFSTALNRRLASFPGIKSAVVPMDGFHLDNEQLTNLGLLTRKGAPETYDFYGFYELIQRLSTSERPVYYPEFDRALDKAIAGAGVVSADTNVVIVEGNYLLLNEDPWSRLAPLFDHSIYLETPFDVLEERLIQRWLDNDHTPEDARARAVSNDIPNAKRVTENTDGADQIIRREEPRLT